VSVGNEKQNTFFCLHCDAKQTHWNRGNNPAPDYHCDCPVCWGGTGGCGECDDEDCDGDAKEEETVEDGTEGEELEGAGDDE